MRGAHGQTAGQRPAARHLALIITLLAAALGACAPEPTGPYDYTIAISTSPVASLSPYGGSVQFERDGDILSRDLSGQGAKVLTIRADRLLSVRVHAAAQSGLHSLKIQRENRMVHDSGAIVVEQPLIYHAPR